MANCKDSPHFAKDDQYYTSKAAWEQINHLIPKDKVIWEACLLNSLESNSKRYLTELGNRVVGDTSWDCFEVQPDFDLIVTNIPFDLQFKQPILKQFVEWNKPFIVILNSMNLFANWFIDIFKSNREHLQIITPKGKVLFEKDGKVLKAPSFYCVYVCYKMNLENNDLYLG